MIWGRREWRKDPDSDLRERRYRMRDENAWVRVKMPDLRIVDDATWDAASDELKSRRRPEGSAPPVRSRRRQHLLSGTILCGGCGSNYVISGKDYYRCAGHKERGTCGNNVSVRKEPLETAVLSVLQSRLLTPEHVRTFVDEFKREVARLERADVGAGDRDGERLVQVDREIANLTANLLAGVVGPTLQKALADREAEREILATRLGRKAFPRKPLPLPTPKALEHDVITLTHTRR